MTSTEPTVADFHVVDAEKMLGGPPMPTNVIAALARVAAELPGIGKDGRAAPEQGGYAYRGIEAITAHAGHLLGKYGVVFVPKINSAVPEPLTINNKPWIEWRCMISYTVYGPGGRDDFIEVGPFLGLGRDNSDKGVNKCMTQAFKYALMQVLCVGDKADEADGTTPETDSWGAPPPTPDEVARQAGWNDLDDSRLHRSELTAKMKVLPEADREKLKAWMDEHEIPATSIWSREQYNALYVEVLALTDPGATVQADPVSGGPTAEPVVSPSGEGFDPAAFDATADRVNNPDDTAMTPEEFEAAFAEGTPVEVAVAPQPPIDVTDTSWSSSAERAQRAQESLAAAQAAFHGPLREISEQEMAAAEEHYPKGSEVYTEVMVMVGRMKVGTVDGYLRDVGLIASGTNEERRARLVWHTLLKRAGLWNGEGPAE